MTSLQIFLLLSALGLLLSTAVYEISQRLRCNDPFAVELASWWVFTDLVLLSKLRNWKLQSGVSAVQSHPEIVLSGLVAAGFLVVLAAILLTQKDGERFLMLDGLASLGIVGYMLRSNLARSLVSMFCSLHLALFLA